MSKEKPTIGDVFETGDRVTRSGIYKVLHDGHAQNHEVTCVFGKEFPPCSGCHHAVTFELVRAAQHIEQNEHFK